MAGEEQAKNDFSNILKSIDRKFDFILIQWLEERFFEVRFRTQIERNSEDFNSLCDEWVDLFSEVTNTVWVKKISNTGPKIRFRKQYQCWTYVGKEVQKELLFNAKRCKGTLDIKVLTDNPLTRRKNKHIKLGLNVVVKINFDHLHRVDTKQPFAFFVHTCQQESEVPQPVVETSDKISQTAETAEEGLTESTEFVEVPINHQVRYKAEVGENEVNCEIEIPINQVNYELPVNQVNCEIKDPINVVNYEGEVRVNQVTCKVQVPINQANYETEVPVNHVSCEVEVPIDVVNYEGEVPINQVNYESEVPVNQHHCEVELPINQANYEAQVPVNEVGCEADISINQVNSETELPVNQVNCETEIPVSRVNCEALQPCPIQSQPLLQQNQDLSENQLNTDNILPSFSPQFLSKIEDIPVSFSQTTLPIVNIDQIQLNQIVPFSSANDSFKVDMQPHFQPLTQVVVSTPQLEMTEPLLMCPPTLMLDPTQVLPVAPHHFIQVPSHNLPIQQNFL